jgi:hypothetical protein
MNLDAGIEKTVHFASKFISTRSVPQNRTLPFSTINKESAKDFGGGAVQNLVLKPKKKKKTLNYVKK